ncbi:MAG: Uma2 family endonuclease [Planctomycetota bacterium]
MQAQPQHTHAAASNSHLLPECCRHDRHETVGGETLHRESIGWKENLVAGCLGFSLAAWAKKTGLGNSLGATAFRLADGLVRTPDGAWIAGGRLDEARAAGGDTFPGAPDLAVLVMSERDSWADVAARIHDLLAHGTREVWAIDAPGRVMHRYAAGRPAATLAESDTLDGGALLPGFTLPVTTLFPK